MSPAAGARSPRRDLGGLTVSAWLEAQAPSTPAAPAVPAATARAPRSARGSSRAGMVRWLVGLALGAYVAIATRPELNCPPSGEGAAYCELQHGVLRAVMTVLGVAALTAIAGGAMAKAPAVARRLRAGELVPPPPKPTAVDDALLLAASRGYRYSSSRRRALVVWRPRWQRI